MDVTKNMEKTMRTTRQIAEAQRDSYEAVADNFASLQRRNVEFARGGLELLKLQESSARATREWFANGVRLLETQQRSATFTRDWLARGSELVREQAEQNRRTAEVFAQAVRSQQQGFWSLATYWTRAYADFVFPYAQQGLRTAQQATRQGVEATEQATRQGLRVAEEATTKTEEALKQIEDATEQAEVEATMVRITKGKSYDDVTVAEFSKELDGLTTRELKTVRAFEKRNKNRETLIEQIDRKIKAAS